MLKRLTKNDCKITIIAEQDMTPVRGNAMASGDDVYDKEVEDEIISRLDNGNVWAWASVVVKCEWTGYVGTDHLGGCSYENEEDFIKRNDYYESMVDAAVDDLNKKLQETFEKIQTLNESHG